MEKDKPRTIVRGFPVSGGAAAQPNMSPVMLAYQPSA